MAISYLDDLIAQGLVVVQETGDRTDSHMQSKSAARGHEAAGRAGEALAAAWVALDAAPDDQEAKARVTRLLDENPDLITADRAPLLYRLLADSNVDPSCIGAAGWTHLLREAEILRAGAEANPADIGHWLETNTFAQRLLCETYVTSLDVEIALTALRRWLLLSGEWPRFPRTVEALAAQAAQNGGAWFWDAEEEERLGINGDATIAATYRPPPIVSSARPVFADLITHAVASQYEGWPYPVWSRVMVSRTGTLPALIEELDPDRPSQISLRAKVLIAGCGTGREAAIWARRYPDARITAIDISQASLRYGAERCEAARLSNIAFHMLDLHDVSSLNRTFDVIVCSGVLHHLPEPEKGWKALVSVLEPGGAMRVMVYSKVGRLRVQAMQALVADLAQRPVDDALLRAVRKRLIEKVPGSVARSSDFFIMRHG